MELLDAEQFEHFRGDKRYSNALGFSVTRPDVLVLAAYPVAEGASDALAVGESAPALADPIAMVGLSDDSPIMRQIGIDVLPAWRGAGIASALVRDAARLTLAEGYLPFYGTSPSHMLSQRVAMNAGLVPTWWGVRVHQPERPTHGLEPSALGITGTRQTAYARKPPRFRVSGAFCY